MSVFKYHAFIYFLRPPPWRTEQHCPSLLVGVKSLSATVNRQPSTSLYLQDLTLGLSHYTCFGATTWYSSSCATVAALPTRSARYRPIRPTFPMKADSHFSRPILVKLAGNQNSNLVLVSTKVFVIEFVRVLSMVYVYFDTEVHKILTACRNQYRESKSVEIFGRYLTI